MTILEERSHLYVDPPHQNRPPELVQRTDEWLPEGGVEELDEELQMLQTYGCKISPVDLMDSMVAMLDNTILLFESC